MQHQVCCRVSVLSFPFLSTGGNFQSQILKREGQKKEYLGGTERVPAMDICLRAYYVSYQKKTFNVLVGCFEISINGIVKHVQHAEVVRAFCLPGGTY